MKITCTENAKHQLFEATAQVHELWTCNQHGDFLDRTSYPSEAAIHAPGDKDSWLCAECGAKAKVNHHQRG